MEAEPLFSAWPGPLRAYQRPEMKLVRSGAQSRLTNSAGESSDSKDTEVVREHSILSATLSGDRLCCVETPVVLG